MFPLLSCKEDLRGICEGLMEHRLSLDAWGCAAILKVPNASNPVLPVRACGVEELPAGPCLRRDVFGPGRTAQPLSATVGTLHFADSGGVAAAEAGGRPQLSESGHHVHRLRPRRGDGKDLSV